MKDKSANLLSLYQPYPPSYIQPFLSAKERKRLKGVNRHCGMEYTSFPFFSSLGHYSRFVHSVGVSYLLSRFTKEPKVILSGLFHDISTPVFAHVIDFLLGDHRKQEATEEKTKERIEGSALIQENLRKRGLTTLDVFDYHRYSLADNASPMLSADRLEYTLSNSVNFGFASETEIRKILSNLVISLNEKGEQEICFRTPEPAERFASFSLKAGRIYSCDEDRYAREYLCHVLSYARKIYVLTRDDLYSTEEEVIGKRNADERTKKRFESFTSLSKVRRGRKGRPYSYLIPVKKRFIDPFVVGRGRVSSFSPARKKERDDFRSLSFDYYLVKDE